MTLAVGNASRGFSLLELVLVLMLIGLSSLVVIPNIEKGIHDREVKSSALALAAVARGLRSRAFFEGLPQQLVIDLPQNSYRADPNTEIHLAHGVKFAEVSGGEILDGDIRQFIFFPNGSSYRGDIVLASTSRALHYSVRFEPLTGKIEVLRGDAS